ncbi:MAG: bud neck involved protein [Vezdaea aestivalis]|nr:MAG: bud neck involved protein [Vezdaea aestivalis]
MAAMAAVPSFAPSFAAPSQQSHQSSRSSSSSQMPRNLYSNAVTGYRPNPQPTVAPYAFTSTPNLASSQSQQASSNSRQETRSPSSQAQTLANGPPMSRPRPLQNPSASTTSSSSSAPPAHSNLARDDFSITTPRPRTNPGNTRPASTISLISLVPSGQNAAGKPSPDRYRRNHRRVDTASSSASGFAPSAMPSGSGMAAVGHLYKHPNRASSSPSLHSVHNAASNSSINRLSVTGPSRGSMDVQGRHVADDMHIQRQSTYDQALNYRRRSVGGLDAVEYVSPGRPDLFASPSHIARPATAPAVELSKVSPRPSSAHGRHSSAESSVSGRSGQSQSASIQKEQMTYAAALQSSAILKQDQKTINIPPRASSDMTKRLNNPSPLSKPASAGQNTLKTSQPQTQSQPAALPAVIPPAPVESPAQQRLAALTERENKKGVKSRLRRAFSFGSAAELRKASAENNMNNANNASADRAKLKKERPIGDEDAEQAAIAQKQEAGGIGENIYSGQGGFFTGSTDNLSISSTASSASIMIRKMGQGMKKSGRSLVGLFRPKSVYGDAGHDDAAPEPSVAQVSMVTVEAEREKVNVNPNPHSQPGGGTGFPHLERNSLDAARVTASRDGPTSEMSSRRSIIGGEAERAEILSSMKKGILKRTDSGHASPISRPIDKPLDFNLPQIPHVVDTPGSSAPSTPRDERSSIGHRRTDSVTIEGEDYFLNLPKHGDDSRSFSDSQITMTKYNVSFSPRLQFHDTWPSLEYDRRGEIATCNRLTPMLAQQIKEELNTFKMEMEVHEQSKVYTHFF